jgi:hypothetical protein
MSSVHGPAAGAVGAALLVPAAAEVCTLASEGTTRSSAGVAGGVDAAASGLPAPSPANRPVAAAYPAQPPPPRTQTSRVSTSARRRQ